MRRRIAAIPILLWLAWISVPLEAVLPRRIRAVQKPLFNAPINWGNPLTNGLVFAFLMNQGSVNATENYVNPAFASPYQSASTQIIHHYTLEGPANLSAAKGGWFFNGGADLLMRTSDNTAMTTAGFDTGPVTVVCDCTPTGTISTLQFLFASGSNVNTYAMAIRTSTLTIGWGAAYQDTAGSTLTTNTRYVMAAVRSGTAGAWTATGYINGKQDSQVTGIATNPTVDVNVNIGSLPPSISFPFTGYIDYCYGWRRALEATEIQSLYVDPYQIFMVGSSLGPGNAPSGILRIHSTQY